jgi:hypothetical protein
MEEVETFEVSRVSIGIAEEEIQWVHIEFINGPIALS